MFSTAFVLKVEQEHIAFVQDRAAQGASSSMGAEQSSQSCLPMPMVPAGPDQAMKSMLRMTQRQVLDKVATDTKSHAWEHPDLLAIICKNKDSPQFSVKYAIEHDSHGQATGRLGLYAQTSKQTDMQVVMYDTATGSLIKFAPTVYEKDMLAMHISLGKMGTGKD